MAKKRRYGVTSTDRYLLKAYRVHYIPGIPEDIVRMVAHNQTASWSAGFGMYSRVWREKVVPILAEMGVPTPFWAPYRAFTNEYLSKVVEKGTATPEQIIEKWSANGCRRDVLMRIVEVLPEKKSQNVGGAP